MPCDDRDWSPEEEAELRSWPAVAPFLPDRLRFAYLSPCCRKASPSGVINLVYEG